MIAKFIFVQLVMSMGGRRLGPFFIFDGVFDQDEKDAWGQLFFPNVVMLLITWRKRFYSLYLLINVMIGFKLLLGWPFLVMGVLLQAQSTEYGLPHVVRFQYQIDVENPDDRNGFISVNIPGPYTGRQRIHELQYNYAPAEIDSSNQEWTLKWDVSDLDELQSILLVAEYYTYRYDYSVAKKLDRSESFGRDDYHTDALDRRKMSNKRWRKLAKSLEGKTNTHTIRNIYNFVLSNYIDQRGKVSSYDDSREPSLSYKNLQAAYHNLLSINNIPNRRRFVISANNGLKYYIVEVYFKDKGWVPFNLFYDQHWNVKDSWDMLHEPYLYYSYETEFSFPKGVNAELVRFTLHPIQRFLEERNERKFPYNKLNCNKISNVLNDIPTYYSALLLRAMCYAENGDFIEAEPLLQYALKNAKGRQKGAVFYAYSRYYCLKGEKERAIQFITKVPEYKLNATRIMHYQSEFDLIRDDTRYKKIHKQMLDQRMLLNNY